MKRLLLVVREANVLRFYDEVISSLIDLDVFVSIRYEQRGFGLSEGIESDPFLRRRGLSYAPLPEETQGLARRLTVAVRELLLVLQYLDPSYDSAPWWRERALGRVEHGVLRSARLIHCLGRWGVAAASWLLLQLEQLLPPPASISELLAEERPDAVAVSPGIWWGSRQIDVVKAAARQGLPTAVWVTSWDNLTTKCTLTFAPDRVFVWNEQQRQELARHHPVPADRAVITGAQSLDRLFNGATTRSSREQFLERLDLDPGRPFLLYLGSSPDIAPDEPLFFLRWLEAIRASTDPVLQQAGIVVRPHPAIVSVEQWLARGLDRLPGIVFFPPRLAGPIAEGVFAEEYLDLLYHCSVAVGINTSGMIEAAVFAKPVCTVRLAELGGQDKTIHFHHLVDPDYGLLHTSSSFDEHVAELERLVRRRPDVRDARSERFASVFLRPHGLEKPAAEVFVEAMRPLLGMSEAS